MSSEYVVAYCTGCFTKIWEENRVRVFAAFFYLLQSKLSKCGSYSHVWHIRKHHLFTSFALKYSQKFTYKYQIWCKKNTCWSEYLLHSKYSLHFSQTGDYSLQNICFEVNIHKTWKSFQLKWIFACKFLHTSKYLLCIASIFTSLRPQLIFGSFWKYSLHYASTFCFKAN